MTPYRAGIVLDKLIARLTGVRQAMSRLERSFEEAGCDITIAQVEHPERIPDLIRQVSWIVEDLLEMDDTIGVCAERASDMQATLLTAQECSAAFNSGCVEPNLAKVGRNLPRAGHRSVAAFLGRDVGGPFVFPAWAVRLPVAERSSWEWQFVIELRKLVQHSMRKRAREVPSSCQG